MKKILFVIAIVVTMACNVNAQSDGFFKSGDSEGYSGRTDTPTPMIPGGQTGTIPDSNAPLGSGLLILTTIGAGYAVMRKKSR